MNYAVAIFFLVDLLAKLVVNGLLFTPNGHFQVLHTPQHDECRRI